MGEFSKQREKQAVVKMTVLEIYKLPTRIVVIVELNNKTIPKAGMYLKLGEDSYKIIGVGLKKNLINSPTYQNAISQKNIRELFFNNSDDLLKKGCPNIIVDLLESSI